MSFDKIIHNCNHNNEACIFIFGKQIYCKIELANKFPLEITPNAYIQTENTDRNYHCLTKKN